MQMLMLMLADLQGMEEIVVEPLLRDILEFSTLVVGTQEGPVASMPLQIRIYDSEEMFIDAELELQRFLNRVKVRTQCIRIVIRPGLSCLSNSLDALNADHISGMVLTVIGHAILYRQSRRHLQPSVRCIQEDF